MAGGANDKKKKGTDKKARKAAIFAKIITLFSEYNKILIVNADNVGSNHMQKIRIALRAAGGVFFMGKNTMIRKALRSKMATNPHFEAILPVIFGNVGFIFTKGDLSAIKKIVDDNKVEAAARAGAVAPSDVVIPAQVTGMEPTKTSFFQALSIATKINKGTIEIINDVHLIKTGDKVGPSESALLAMLNVKPFKYGLVAQNVFDSGSIYEAKVLDITNEDILEKFALAVKNVASVSLALDYPTLASVPHSIKNGFKKILSIGLATTYSFKQVEAFKNAAATAPASAPAKAEEKKDDKKGGADDAAKKKADAEKKKKEEEEKKKAEEEDADMGLGLFD